MSTKKTAAAASDPEPFFEAMASIQKSIGLIVDSPALSMSRSIAQMVDDMVKLRQNTLGAILDNMPKIILPSSILYLPKLPPPTTEPKIEIVGGSDVVATGTITTEEKPKRQKRKFGLYFITGNSVQYNRKTLRALSLESQHGQLLKIFIEANGHFVPDSVLLKTFNKEFISDISFIIRNLKQAFRANNLEIIIERRKNAKGYVLVDIKEGANNTD